MCVAFGGKQGEETGRGFDSVLFLALFFFFIQFFFFFIFVWQFYSGFFSWVVIYPLFLLQLLCTLGGCLVSNLFPSQFSIVDDTVEGCVHGLYCDVRCSSMAFKMGFRLHEIRWIQILFLPLFLYIRYYIYTNISLKHVLTRLKVTLPPPRPFFFFFFFFFFFQSWKCLRSVL